MMITRFYRGQPVKRMRKGARGIILTMYSAKAGQTGQQMTVTQADWDAHGHVDRSTHYTADQLRQLVR